MAESNISNHDASMLAAADRRSNAARHPVIYTLAEVALLCLLGLLFYGATMQG